MEVFAIDRNWVGKENLYSEIIFLNHDSKTESFTKENFMVLLRAFVVQSLR